MNLQGKLIVFAGAACGIGEAQARARVARVDAELGGAQLLINIAGVALVSPVESLARTAADEAARQIVLAIARDRDRLPIGSDAVVMDLPWRLFPVRASLWLTRAMARMRERAAPELSRRPT